MLPAGRRTDTHVCPSHEGGPLDGKAAKVEINSLPAARATDRASCKGSTDFIITGAATVEIMGKPAARITSKTLHKGDVILGSTNVLIGGPSAGVTLGNPTVAWAACQVAAMGRTSGRTQQSYSNCGVEASRIIINQATGKRYTEDDTLDWAMEHDDATRRSHRERSGSTSPGDREKLLRDHGVESDQKPQEMSSLAQDVAEGKGVITSHDAGILWDDSRALGGGHAVVMTGVTYDANGDVESVTVLDTGTGNCESKVPADRFKKSLLGWPRKANVTQKPIWPRS